MAGYNWSCVRAITRPLFALRRDSFTPRCVASTTTSRRVSSLESLQCLFFLGIGFYPLRVAPSLSPADYDDATYARMEKEPFFAGAFAQHWHNRYDWGIPERSWAGILLRRHQQLLAKKVC